MSFKVLCLLILLNSLQTNARGRIPISQFIQNSTNISRLNADATSTEHLNLPRGFNPQSPPTNPLLYPFATEQPALNKTSTTPGWRPIVTENINSQSSSNVPLLQDRAAFSAESQQDLSSIAGPVLESIVYGTWKPVPPAQPNLTQTQNKFMENANSNGLAASLENVLNGKIGGFIEEIGSRQPLHDSNDKSMTSNESFENVNSNKKQFNRKMGRRKIPTTTNKKQSNESQPTTSTQINSMEIIRLNATDPALLNIVKQINESVEASTKSIKNAKAISKEWPTDFLNSPESEQIQESSSIQDNSFSFIGDSSEPPQALNGLNEAETKTPPINITKMGIPFENLNSDEEPSICVPLAVREPSVSNPMEIVEVERVYCFPLPAPEVRSNIESTNETLIFDKDAKFNVLSYEELMASNVRSNNKKSVWILILSFLLIK